MDAQKIGRFIALNRKKVGLTQKQMAEKLGVTDKTVSRWENGNYMPDLSLLIPMSQKLDVTLNELLQGEYIQEEDVAKKAEGTLFDTIVYSNKQVKKEKRRTCTIISICVAVFVAMLLLFDYVYFSPSTYYYGEATVEDGTFPNNSAYQLAFNEADEIVFKNHDAAFEHAQSDYSDIVDAIQEEYRLMPFSKYTYKLYRQHAEAYVSDNEMLMEQREGFLNFLEIYSNSYDWKDLTHIGQTNSLLNYGEGETGEERLAMAWAVPLTSITFSMLSLGLAICHAFMGKRRAALPNETEGEIIGLLRSTLFKNYTYGEVPGGTIMGWGVSQGEQYWGGGLKMRIPPWFPCVRFTANGKEYIRLMGEGNYKEAWMVGQKVTVIYDATEPRISIIRGDDTYKIKSKIELGAGIALMIFGICSLFLLI